jgi:hypothetical protein
MRLEGIADLFGLAQLLPSTMLKPMTFEIGKEAVGVDENQQMWHFAVVVGQLPCLELNNLAEDGSRRAH